MHRHKLLGLKVVQYGAIGVLWAALYAVLFAICNHNIDPDFGWHLQAGRYYAAHGIPHHDIFSFTAPTFPWINHEWLSDVLIAGLFHIGGMTMVSIVFGGLWTVMLAAAARGKWTPAVLGAAALCTYVANRPLVFTPLFLGLTLWLWWKRPGRRWLIPLVFIPWANLHGGFSLGLVILLGLIVWERQWRWWWLVPLAIAATFINPYGPHIYVEIWRTLSDHQLTTRIAEWGPLRPNFSTFQYIFVVLFGLIGLNAWRTTNGLVGIALLAGTVFTNRQIIPFVAVSLPIVTRGYMLCKNWLLVHFKYAVIVAPIAAAIVLGISSRHQLDYKRTYPAAAAADLRAHPCKGNVFNPYDYGGYLIWQVPGERVYIDGRMPSWKDDGKSYMDRYEIVEEGGHETNTEFARLNIRCAIVAGNKSALAKHLQKQGWHKHDVTPVSTLWRKDY